MTDPKTPAQAAQEKRREAHEAIDLAADPAGHEMVEIGLWVNLVNKAHSAIDSAIQAARQEVASEAHVARCLCTPEGYSTGFHNEAVIDSKCLAFRERIGRGE